MTDHCFISYSTTEAFEFATKLANELSGGYPSIPVWFDKRDLRPGMEWDVQIDDGLKSCKLVLFVMTKDSINEKSVCKQEWSRALSYKKLVIPLLLQKNINTPFRLGDRQRIDFTQDFQAGVDQLRRHIAWLDSPEGVLQSYKDRLADAERDIQRASDEDKPRIKAELDELTEQIKRQEEIVRNPKAAEEKTEKNIQSGLERERKPERPVISNQLSKFINPPPGIAPNYFQDRFDEIKEIKKFLENDAQRLLTIVGRAGVGKTAMVCRLLKALERGELPDDLGEMKVDGIVYLSETGSHRVNFANVFADLSKLLPASDGTVERLEGIYKNPQTSTGDKMRALLDAFPSGRVILLLDNFETLIQAESLSLRDSELSDALNALLGGQHHAVKAVITTRIAPRDLAISEPGRQHHLSLDEGLESPYAENVLREMDADGRVGLKSAPDALLKVAREKTRGYPRALEALYAILSVDRYTTLEELLEISLPDEVVQKLVGEAFNRLDPSAQKVMQALAVYNRPVSPAAIDYLLQLHLPSIDSALVLNRLVNMHFARREAGRYYLHPADKEYAFSIIPVEEILTAESQSARRKPKEISAVSASLRLNLFTQHDLLNRAADYFAQARKPRAEWKKLDDLTAQLAEFDLRYAAGDYDTAASVLLEVGDDYLFLWGHYRLMIDLHEKIQRKINDSKLKMFSLGTLGSANAYIGNVQNAIFYQEQALSIARDKKDRRNEGAYLCNLGNRYADLGNARKAIEFYEQALVVLREVGDHRGEGITLGLLGNRYADLGDARNSIEFYEQALVIAREIGDKIDEGVWLGNLGNRYTDSGNTSNSIEFYEQALTIARETGDRNSEGTWLNNIAESHANLDNIETAIINYEPALVIRREILARYGVGSTLGNLARVQIARKNYKDAIQFAQESIVISQEIKSPLLGSRHTYTLALAQLFAEDLIKALRTIENALGFDVTENNHNISALHGIIALRQGERETAQEAFMKSIAQADEILAKTPDYYSALDAKGLAVCGLAITTGDSHLKDDCHLRAIETFRKAREIAPHAGVVKSVLRVFDELVKCDEEGVLKGVREVIADS